MGEVSNKFSTKKLFKKIDFGHFATGKLRVSRETPLYEFTA